MSGKYKHDCFAFRQANAHRCRCAILTEMICKEKECPFYKTKQKFEEGYRKNRREDKG